MKSSNEHKNLDEALYSPHEVARLTKESIEREAKDPEFLNIGDDIFGDKFVMARKSKVVGILGDTSQGKTSIMRYIAANMAKQIDVEKNEIGLFVTWEDNIEDFGMVDFANIAKIPVRSLYNGQISEGEFKRLITAEAKRSASPLWLAGHSEMSVSRPMLTMRDVFSICEELQVRQGKRIRFIFLDYLQRISREDTNERDTRMQFVKIMDLVKNLALSYRACVFIGSQVRRDQVEKSGKDRQPQTHWAMETANFEHSCDGMISVWMPYMSKDIYQLGMDLDGLMDKDNRAIPVTKELVSIQVLKQKKGETGMRRYMDFLPEYGMYVPHKTAAAVREQIKKENPNA